jgi:restriction endonuclease
VQALREGWDCSFAYILCTLAEQHSAKSVEQILGRVLRLPRAQRQSRPELNVAYAYALSASFAATAKEKLAVGNLWAARSGGRCVFVMVTARKWTMIDEAIARRG